MLSTIFKGVTGIISDTVDVTMSVGGAIVEDIIDIPSAISEGWDEGFMEKDEVESISDKVVEPQANKEVSSFGQ